MKRLLLLLPLMLNAAQPAKQTDIPSKCKVFVLPKEVVAAEQERKARRKKRIPKDDIAASLRIPSPNLRQSDSPKPAHSPKHPTIIWDMICEGKLVRMKVNVEPVKVKLRFGATTTKVERKDEQ